MCTLTPHQFGAESNLGHGFMCILFKLCVLLFFLQNISFILLLFSVSSLTITTPFQTKVVRKYSTCGHFHAEPGNSQDRYLTESNSTSSPNILFVCVVYFNSNPFYQTLFLACTVTQYKNKSKTIKWMKSRNWDAIGDW